MNITRTMIDASARAIYARTKVARTIEFDLLPEIAKQEVREVARIALYAAEPLRPKPES
jgi:hypothetical protein